jgi:hypothetical protein
VRQESPPEDDSSIYYIFERINTGGTPLSSQEIRACIYHGDFNDLLGDLNNNPSWREIFGRPNKRMKDQELILRFFAFYFDLSKYQKPMKEFLNSFMARNRNLQEHPLSEFIEVFEETTEVVASILGSDAFRPVRALNAAIFDSVMVAVAKRLRDGPIVESREFENAYQRLLQNEDYLLASLKSTANEKSVGTRFTLAMEGLLEVK